jgi:broad specificity phosphatase PhoE
MPETKKKIYFVRHGESKQNVTDTFQDDEIELSEKGLKQAEFLAHRLSKLGIGIIFGSPIKRAHQTAEIIGKQLGKEVVYDNLFIEIRRPSVIRGKGFEDKEASAIWEDVWSHRLDSNYKHSDEENFTDRKARAKRVTEKLLECKEDYILVVAHGGIIRSIVAYMLLGDSMTAEEYFKFIAFMQMSNTGISMVKFPSHEGLWQLHTWNDLAHLD